MPNAFASFADAPTTASPSRNEPSRDEPTRQIGQHRTTATRRDPEVAAAHPTYTDVDNATLTAGLQNFIARYQTIDWYRTYAKMYADLEAANGKIRQLERLLIYYRNNIVAIEMERHSIPYKKRKFQPDWDNRDDTYRHHQ